VEEGGGKGGGFMRIWSGIAKKFVKWRDINIMKLYQRADQDNIWNKRDLEYRMGVKVCMSPL
jgi:hypothetical protein